MQVNVKMIVVHVEIIPTQTQNKKSHKCPV